MISDFQKVYNNSFITEETNNLIIKETDSQAKIKSVNFKYERLYNISKDILTKTNSIYSNSESLCGYSYYKNCDGAFFVEHSGNWILCLCELKTTFDFDTFRESKIQLEASFLKLITILYPLKSFNLDRFKSILFMVSKKPDLENPLVKIKMMRLRNTSLNNPTFFMYKELIEKNKITINEKSCAVATKPIKKKFNIIDSDIYFIEGNSHDIELADYIN